MRDIVFRGSAFDDFNAWSKADKHTLKD